MSQLEPAPNFAASGSDSADYSVLSKASSADSEKLSVVSPPRPPKLAVNPLQKRPKKRVWFSTPLDIHTLVFTRRFRPCFSFFPG